MMTVGGAANLKRGCALNTDFGQELVGSTNSESKNKAAFVGSLGRRIAKTLSSLRCSENHGRCLACQTRTAAKTLKVRGIKTSIKNEEDGLTNRVLR